MKKTKKWYCNSKWILCEKGECCPNCGGTLRFNTGKFSNKLLCKHCNQLFNKGKIKIGTKLKTKDI